MKKKIVATVFVSLVLTDVAFAQKSSSDKEKNETLINLNQVVVTGTGTHQKLTNSPIPITVITARDLSNAGVTTLDEALQKLTPSFSSMTNGMGTTLSLNGLPDDYFVFLENGRRLYGDDTYQRINVANIKRIEILSGASSALYGTNAIGGVINIITADADNQTNITSDTRYANKGRFTQSVNADIQKSKFGSYTSYRRQQADNWQLNPYEEDSKTGELKPTDKPASTGFYSDVISQKFTLDPSDRLSLYLRGSFYKYKTRRPFEAYDYNLKHQTYTYGAGAQYTISKGNYLFFDYFADNYSSYYDFYKDNKTYGGKTGEEQLRKRTNTHNAQLKGIFRLGESNKLTVGAEFIGDKLKSESDNIDKETAYTLALFAQDEIRLADKLQALVGLRYIYHENFHSHATPNVALMYKPGNFRLRASYAAGFRTPTLSELYATDIAKKNDRLTIGNLNLKPEKNDYYSVNAEYNHARFSVSANIFYNKIRDMITLVYIAKGDEAMENYGHEEVRQRQNTSRAHILGVNLAANAYLGAGVNLSAAYTHLDTEDEELNQPIDKSIRNAYSVNANWSRQWRSYRIYAGINGRINSRRFSKSYGYAPAYQLWDLNTRHTFYLKDFVVEPGIGIENLFDYTDDRPYNNNYATLTPGRSVYVSLTLKFNK